jgi:DNA-binding CsgD family transcriptional regulator
MARRGPKGKFNDKVREAFLRLIKEGKTEDEIGDVLGVTRRTLNNWKGKHQELLYAVREARQTADELVEASLYSRALGYSHPEEKVHFDKDGGVHTHDTTKHYPPDTQAAMFWLRNRQPKRWKEKTEGDVTVTTQVGTMTDEELDAKIADRLSKQLKENKK